jgi:hypothetical protein
MAKRKRLFGGREGFQPRALGDEDGLSKMASNLTRPFLKETGIWNLLKVFKAGD